MKVRDILVLLREDGWYHVRTRGSHRQLKHPTKPNTVTVAGNESRELAIATWRSILRQASLR